MSENKITCDHTQLTRPCNNAAQILLVLFFPIRGRHIVFSFSLLSIISFSRLSRSQKSKVKCIIMQVIVWNPQQGQHVSHAEFMSYRFFSQLNDGNLQESDGDGGAGEKKERKTKAEVVG